LTISPGNVTFEFRQFTPILGTLPKIEQAGGTVTAVRARLLPPGLNTAIIVRGVGGEAVQVMTWFGRHRRVLSALTTAGFAIEDVVLWISCGARLARAESRASHV
jgi:hypothetical protein